MLRPTRLTAAHGPITSTRHSRPRSATSASSATLSSEFAAGSSDTVTLVSDVDTRSMDKPCCLNTANASARKPTECHIPTVSIEMSVMFFLIVTAFTCAATSPPCVVMTVPSSFGVCVA